MGPTSYVVMRPKTIRCKHGNVRKVSHTVIWITKDRLPGWLCPPLTASACDSADGRQAGRAGARSTSASHCGLEVLLSERTVAEATRAESCRVPFETCKQRTRAGIVPGNFRHVGKCGRKCGRVGRAPISAVRVGESVAEVRPAHRYIVRTGS